MEDVDSDPEYSDFDFSSPLSTSQILRSKTSSQRLYSQHPPAAVSEHTSLLGHADIVRGGYAAASSSREGNLLSRKISRVFQSKAYDYDANKSSLAAVGSGERVWYFPVLRCFQIAYFVLGAGFGGVSCVGLRVGSVIIGLLIGFMTVSRTSFGRKS